MALEWKRLIPRYRRTKQALQTEELTLQALQYALHKEGTSDHNDAFLSLCTAMLSIQQTGWPKPTVFHPNFLEHYKRIIISRSSSEGNLPWFWSFTTDKDGIYPVSLLADEEVEVGKLSVYAVAFCRAVITSLAQLEEWAAHSNFYPEKGEVHSSERFSLTIDSIRHEFHQHSQLAVNEQVVYPYLSYRTAYVRSGKKVKRNPDVEVVSSPFLPEPA